MGGFDDISSSQVWPYPLISLNYLITSCRKYFVENFGTFMQHTHLAAEGLTKSEGHSYPLCEKIVNALRNRSEKFQIQTLHVLGRNTRWDSEGIACPIFHGFVVSLSF